MEEAVFSIWEKESFLKYDYIVIGGGITGLSTAIAITESQKDADVLVIDRGFISEGASTKNAGFATFGSFTEILDDIDKFGKDAALQLVEDRVRGLELLRKRVGDENMDFRTDGGYELIPDNLLPSLEKLDELNESLFQIFKDNPYRDATTSIKKFGFNGIKSMLFTPFEGQLNSGKLMRAMRRQASLMDVNFIDGTIVRSFEAHETKVDVYVEHAMKTLRFETSRLAVCTNAYTKLLVPEIDLMPGRGLIIVSKPVKNLLASGSFHFDRGYYYFRNFGDRILLGGGRNIDFESEATTEPGINKTILKGLKSRLHKIIIPYDKAEIEHVWSGIMAFGSSKAPVIKLHSENVAIAARFGGMGIALASLAGQKVAGLLTGQG